MVQHRANGLDLRINLLVNYGKQLGRSLLLLAHYTTVFAQFLSSSVRCMVAVAKWTSLFARCTTEAFGSVYRHLNRWGKKVKPPVPQGTSSAVTRSFSDEIDR